FQRNWFWTRIENLDRDRSLLPVQAPPPGPPCLLCGVVGSAVSGSANAREKKDLEQTTPLLSPRHVVLGPGGVPTFVEEVPIGRLQAYTLGYEHELPRALQWMKVGLGAQATTYSLPPQLVAIYGRHPVTVVAFLRFRPAGNLSAHMKLMHQ